MGKLEYSCLLVLLILLIVTVVSYAEMDLIPVSITDSGIEEVENFSTVIIFYLQAENFRDDEFNITVSPMVCCLNIEKSDSICGGIIELRPPANLVMKPFQSSRVEFMFRNLYTRYRSGNCTFSVYAKTDPLWMFEHTINFTTYPEDFDDTIVVCAGVDQDADRSCSPADCAIKYNGKRNYYRNSTGKCEKVTKCDTRGGDGVSVVAYYDWDNNLCHPLDSILNDDVSIEERDVVIPAELDPSQNTIFPDFEPSRIKELMDTGEYTLKCNHGVQKGVICECDHGYMSSGVHELDLLEFHWCDTRMVNRAQMEPRKLSKPVEVVISLLLSVTNLFLLVLWGVLSYKLLYNVIITMFPNILPLYQPLKAEY